MMGERSYENKQKDIKNNDSNHAFSGAVRWDVPDDSLGGGH